ncbi:hypothetical protein TIFTF001_020866 [Ficus carica]|uniref:glycerophosphodiester phosphodiesterase n=1 Tax=Ficus carica TaxID=3494 RepID=A0AA88DJP4_FICCA|nr:hypothetical protein TIFTF001_020866 [Ficus carica]
MCNSRALVVAAVLVLQSVVALVSAQGSGTTSPWQTLSVLPPSWVPFPRIPVCLLRKLRKTLIGVTIGAPPLTIARGGFSGLFPDSSYAAYSFALMTSVPDVVLWCDVQLTKDSVGICFPDIKLENSSDISDVFKNRDKEYVVNGVPTSGWFSVDFTSSELANVFITQGIYSRSNKFDGNLFQILTPETVAKELKPPGLWLNIQHDAFFAQHKLSMRNYVLNITRRVVVSYISSPEVNFLNGIKSRFNSNTTKLIFRFLGQDEIEPSTNQTYGSLLKNLTSIKTFASGILVPKYYIWPQDVKGYLQSPSSIVSDAHKQGLEVFASGFVNDFPLSYNYSYDPVAEYLNYIDNGVFSVDGVLSDFPITPSAATDCFANLGNNATDRGTLPPFSRFVELESFNALVISKFGASGDFPGCTDKAYTKAIEDGVNVLDCPVQMSKDGIPFCFSYINLIDSTDAAQSPFSDRTTRIPKIKSGNGIFTFSLTWSEIQDLTPVIESPFSAYTLYRNPNNIHAGKFITLSDFLDLTKNTKSLSGILIGIEFASYLAEEQSLSVTDAVLNALSKAGFDNLTTPKVMIQSSNSSVLLKFKEKSHYELVYKIDENIRSIDDVSMEDIKGFAHSVVVSKATVFPDTQLFLKGSTDVVKQLQSNKLPVYVELFSNEFTSQAWDFFSDATVEVNSYVTGANVNGVITGFPKTSARYKKNRCLLGNNTPSYMSAVAPGSLMELITPQYLPPAAAPNPILTVNDVSEPPLPSVAPASPPARTNSSSAAGPSQPNAQPKIATCYLLSNLAMLLAALVLF